MIKHLNKFKYIFLNSPFIASFIMTSIYFVLFYLLFGFYFENTGSLVRELILQPELFGIPGGYKDPVYFRVFDDIIGFFNNEFPSVPWYGIIYYTIIFILTLLVTSFIHKTTLYYNLQRPILVFLVTSFFFFIICWSENLLLLSWWRLAFMITLVSILFLFCGNFQIIGIKLKTHHYLFSYLLFLAGYLIRYEITILLVLLILPVYAILFQISQYRQHVKKVVTWLPMLVILIMFIPKTFFGIELKKSDDYLWKIYPYLRNIVDRNHVNKNAIQTSKDSIKVEAIKKYFTADTTEIGYSFYRKVSEQNQFSYKKVALLFNFSSAFYKAYLPHYIHHSAIVMVAFWVILVLTIFSKDKKTLILIICFNIFYLIIVSAIPIISKMENRVFYPLFQVLIVYNCIMGLFMLDNDNIDFRSQSRFWFNIITVLIILSATFLTLLKYNIYSHKKMEIHQDTQKITYELFNLYPKKNVVIDIRTLDIFDHSPFVDISSFIDCHGKFIGYDLHIYPLVGKETHRVITDFSGSLKMVPFYRKVYEKKLPLLSSKRRLNLISRYLDIVHGVHVQFNEISKKTIVNELTNDMNYFRISKFNK